jgi:hypothetical protein
MDSFSYKNFNSKTYQHLIDAFGEERIKNRYATLWDYMTEFIARHHYEENLKISKNAFSQMIVDYFVDIDRLKQFHGIERISTTKIYSYTAFWLIKRKPLMIINDNLEDYNLTFANERFVTGYLLRCLNNENISTLILDEKKPDYIDFVDNMMYFLQYRVITAQAIETILFAFKAGKAIQYSEDYQD